MNFIDEQKKRIREHVRIVYPEGGDPRIVSAAVQVAKEGIATPILIGSAEEIAEAERLAGVSTEGIEKIDPSVSEKLSEYVDRYSSETGFPAAASRVIIAKPLGFGAAMVRFDDADGMVGGIANTTANLIQNSRQIIGLEEGINSPSSLMVMDTPHYATEEGNYLIYADPGVNPHPTPEELADIAIASARSARRMLDWEPRVAMLSFSTQGSAKHPDIDRVIEALEIARQREPDLLIDGEMQADAALVPDVAKAKMQHPSEVAGRANILIFPDLTASNIAFKLTQRLGEAGAFGPFLQGFAKTVSDLSRGSTVEDVIGVSVMAALEIQGRRNNK